MSDTTTTHHVIPLYVQAWNPQSDDEPDGWELSGQVNVYDDNANITGQVDVTVTFDVDLRVRSSTVALDELQTDDLTRIVEDY